MAQQCISPQNFTSFLNSQTPVYDKEIIRDLRPNDGWIGHVEAGVWQPYSNTTHVYDRFRQVMPNVTKQWEAVTSASCIGNPCDPAENQIGWGWERREYGQERQSWVTQLLCFDQIMTKTGAQEQFAQIVSDILKPATSMIASQFARKRALDLAGEKWLADQNMTEFTFVWETTGDEEIYLVVRNAATGALADPVSKLTPQMLQRRFSRLQYVGYFGKQPFKDMPALVELVSDMNTIWDLDKAATDTNVSDRWRFTEWEAANKYYRYGFGGQIGNFVVREDPFSLRFNRISTGRYQIVLPYRNGPTTEGIGSEPNPDFDLAQYQISMIMHRRAFRILTASMESVNPLMPFALRSLGGQWQFVMDNLGQDCNGNVIENKRRNKGMFLADFVLAAQPAYTEFMEAIFHMREPAYVIEVAPCAADPGYPTQYYSSSNADCTTDTIITPEADGDGNFVIAENTITCDGVALTNQAAFEGASVADVVNFLNTDPGASSLGTWSIHNGTQILLTDTECESVSVPFVTT